MRNSVANATSFARLGPNFAARDFDHGDLQCQTSDLIGTILACKPLNQRPISALVAAGDMIAPGFGLALALLSIGALVATMGINAYSGMLTIVTGLNSLFGIRPSAWLRIVAILALTAVWLTLSFAFSVSFGLIRQLSWKKKS